LNGEAIYGTEPAPECQPETTNGFRCFATKKGRAIYLHVLQWPGSGWLGRVAISRSAPVKWELLDARLKGLKVTTRNAGASTTLELAPPETIDPYATVIKLSY
jgi:hypothetical protein